MKPYARLRLGNLGMVNRIDDARKALLYRIALVEASAEPDVPAHQQKFRVTIDGDLVNPDLIALVRPLVLRELKAQVAQLERDLEALGIDV